jgi:RNA polymerase sigma factor (sigma-70 family)
VSDTTAKPLQQTPMIASRSKRLPVPADPGADRVAAFEQLYRSQVDVITAYFARRSADPQSVADLTADTFVQAIVSFGTFDPQRGSGRSWLFGIARRVYAAHCEAHSQAREKAVRLAGRRELDDDQIVELIDRIDAEHVGRRLVSGLTSLPPVERAVVELVDLAGLRTKEAAGVLGISSGAARMRLMRGRARLRKTIDTPRSE